MAMLEVKDLQVYYGVIQALKGISFHVNQGEGYCADRCQRCRKDNHTSDTYRNSFSEVRKHCV